MSPIHKIKPLTKNIAIITIITLTIFITTTIIAQPAITKSKNRLSKTPFNGSQAYQDVIYQTELGPRTPGSSAHQATINYIVSELEKNEWQTEIQSLEIMGHAIHNVIAKRGRGEPWIILGTHYDSRIYADQDPNQGNRTKAVPGANDGASGVAVLIELGRVLPNEVNKQIWLVFFDAEDNGNIAGWDWILGSQAFVDALSERPDAAVIVDMVGDKDLNIYKELNSDPILSDNIWNEASALGYSQQFIKFPKYRMLDDHIAFLQADIPAVDIIDFDYPFWHTTEDTVDKVSPQSLKIVGDTLLSWLTKAY